jgi:protease-4
MKTITPTTAQLRMLASIKGETWMIRPDMVQSFALSALELGEQKADSDDWLSNFYTKRQAAFIDGEGIAHIEVRGALMNKAPSIYEKWGVATTYSTIIAETNGAKTQGAKGILYSIDSPGGTVAGVIEGGSAITNVGIPTVAFCQGLACSAAYWLPSGCNQIVATPSAIVGNIGAIISWADCSAFWQEMGIEFKALVSEGADLKSTFHLEPNETQTEFLQESINEAGAAFRDHVAKGRAAAGAEITEEIWRAGWYSGQKAGDLGLIDRMGSKSDAVGTLRELIQK